MIGSIIGGVFGKMGADAAADSAMHAAEVQRQAAEQARKDLSPWRSAGQAAIDEAMQLLGLGKLTAADGSGQVGFDQSNRTADQEAAQARFKTDPGYEFNFSEGKKAIDRSLAAKGGALSGAGVKAGIRFASGMADQTYDNYFNRLTGVSGVGASSAGQSAQVGMQGAQAQGNALISAGQARQSGYNALGSGLGRGISNLINFF